MTVHDCFCERCELARWNNLLDDVKAAKRDEELVGGYRVAGNEGAVLAAVVHAASLRDGRYPFGIAERLGDVVTALHAGAFDEAEDAVLALISDEQFVIDNGEESPCQRHPVTP